MPSDELATEQVYHVHDILGRRVRVFDTLGDYLIIRQALSDELLDDQERFHVLLALVYPAPQIICDELEENITHFLAETLWDCFGIDIEGTKQYDDERVLDWDEDRQRMIVTSRAAYNMSWDELELVSYKEACALMMLAPHETPMGQAIYYRLGKPPKETKYNREQVKAWREARDHYRLQESPERKLERMMQAQQAQFDALAEMAKAAQNG